MRSSYVVQPGDSPAKIASKPDMAGCPKCGGIDFVLANPHKESIRYPNGFTTFKELKVGEKLNLPSKWFDGSLDHRPPAYFSALPHPDGVTPSKLGALAAGVLGDYTQFDAASATAAALAQMDDRTFSNAVDGACTLVDQSVREADGSANLGVAAYAQAVHLSTNAARQRNQDLVKAITANDHVAASAARLDIQNDLLTAINAAQLALQAVYGSGGTPPPPIPPAAPSAVLAAAQAAAAAIAADPNFCASVAHTSSAVNAAMHAFKTAWNAANPNAPVPINTGNYEQATADVLTHLLGAAPPACPPHGGAVPPPPVPGGDITPPQDHGLSTGAIVSIGLLGVGAVGGAIYLATREQKPRARRVQRVRPRPPMIRPDQNDTVAPWKKDFS